MKTIKFLSLFLIISTLSFTACDDDNDTADPDVASIVNATDLYVTEDVDEETSDETVYSKTASDVSATCFTVEVIPNDDGSFWPRNWVIDFGTDGCESYLGITRTGKIYMSLTDYWKNVGSLRTTTFEDFFVDGNQIEGVKTVENIGENADGLLSWERKIENGKVTFADGTSTTIDCNRVSVMVAGADTFVFADDEYDVTGTSSGVDRNGVPFTTEITVPLHFINGCRFPVSGELTITSEGLDTPIVIDYGDGTCDNLATQTIGTEVTEIELGNFNLLTN